MTLMPIHIAAGAVAIITCGGWALLRLSHRFVLSGSRQQSNPEQIRFIPVSAILALLPLGVMIYWLLRGFLMRRSSRPDLAIQA